MQFLLIVLTQDSFSTTVLVLSRL